MNKNLKNIDNSSNYKTNKLWLREKMTNTPFILRGLSALEYLGYFSGWARETTIYVYGVGSLTDVILETEKYQETIDFMIDRGVKCITFEEAINEYLENEDSLDFQPLYEALSIYKDEHHSFENLKIKEENQEVFKKVIREVDEYDAY